MKKRDAVNAYKRLIKNRGYRDISIIENKYSRIFLIFAVNPYVGNFQQSWFLTEEELLGIVGKE